MQNYIMFVGAALFLVYEKRMGGLSLFFGAITGKYAMPTP